MSYEYRLTQSAHLDRINQIARKQTRGSNVDWEEAVQVAQLKLLTAVRAGKFRQGNEQDFDRWASTVARFAIIDLVRKEKAQSSLVIEPPDPFDALEALAQAEAVLAVRAAIKELDRQYPDRGYSLLWLGKVQEKKQSELAQELGLSQGAISKRWQELLHRLAVVLQDPLPSSQQRQRSPDNW
jgi:RNA polymerase sigma factor (sigma-70 family)